MWKQAPHPEVAKAYVRARSGDSAVDRLKRARKLESWKPNNAVSLMAVAESALEARELALARSMAEAAARIAPTESVFLLLADIEEADTGDEGRIRHWMNQALKSPRDAAWIADGVVSQEWLPVSPVSGRLDAFEWKMPVNTIDGPLEEGGVSRGEAAIRSLPPLAAPTSAQKPVEAQDEATTSAVPVETVERTTAIAVPVPTESVIVHAPVEPAHPLVVREADEANGKDTVKKEDAAIAAKVPSQPAPGTASAAKPAEAPVEPFFGRPPDDPGVRKDRVAEKTTFKIF